MDTKIAAKIDRHKRELEDSSLHPETKENLNTFIDKVAFASNGCPDKLAALVELVGDLCFMKIEDRVRQPVERRAEISAALREFADSHNLDCPVRKLTTKLPNGKEIPPWEKPSAGLSAFSISFKEGIRANGTAAIVFGAVCAVVLTIYGIGKWQTNQFRTMIDQKITAVVQNMVRDNGD